MKFRPKTPEEIALPERIAQLEGDETIRGIVFQSIDRSLVEVFGGPAVDEVRERAGLVGQRFDAMAKYPMKSFLRYEEEAARRLASRLGGFDAGVHRIGAAAVDSFFESIAGRTMALLAGKDPTRLLTAVPNGYGLLVSYGERSWHQTDANHGVFRFRHEFLGPVHNLGTFDTALRLVHGVDASIELDAESDLDFDFRISW